MLAWDFFGHCGYVSELKVTHSTVHSIRGQ